VRNVIRDKNEYGVFGYATRIDGPARAADARRRSQTEGPTAFLKGKTDGSGG
jgi:hypothetical protein